MSDIPQFLRLVQARPLDFDAAADFVQHERNWMHLRGTVGADARQTPQRVRGEVSVLSFGEHARKAAAT
jgi:hypothetical protein